MRRSTVAIAAACLATALLEGPSAVAQPSATATIFAGGGTLLSNGLFFPGTLIKDGTVGEISLPPVQIQKGTDFEFVTLDEGTIANGHKIQSFKRKRGRALFASKLLNSPGERSLVVTSHLKPGVYRFYCPVHAGMYGHIQIVKG